jgi:hypothetical protein
MAAVWLIWWCTLSNSECQERGRFAIQARVGRGTRMYLIVEKGKRERVLARLTISLCSNQKQATVDPVK